MSDRPSQLPDPPGAFAAPWQLRSYGLAVALGRHGLLDEAEFARKLEEPPVDPREPRTDPPSAAVRWVAVLEQLLVTSGRLGADELPAAVEAQRVVAATNDHGRSTHVARDEPAHIDPGRAASDPTPTECTRAEEHP